MRIFANQNCLSTLADGIEAVGRLGFRLVSYPVVWLCSKVLKICNVVWRHLSKQTPSVPAPLLHRMQPIPIPKGPIQYGQGEYLVYRRLPGRVMQEVSKETFAQVYPLLIADPFQDRKVRYETLQQKIKEIDPSLELQFVPSTLYGLTFVKACIREDVRAQKICSMLDQRNHRPSLKLFNGDQEALQKYQDKLSERMKERRCWHLCYFDSPEASQHPGMAEVAFRLNRKLLKRLAPKDQGCTFQDFQIQTEKVMTFLKTYHAGCKDLMDRIGKGEKIKTLSDCNNPGPTTNFGYESSRGSIQAMGIRSEKDAEIYKNALRIECSNLAQSHYLLYRGGDFAADVPFVRDTPTAPYSLSMATSPFAGCIFDGGACAAKYMRDAKNAYVFPIPLKDLETGSSPVFVPPQGMIQQFFSDGEAFHARTKAWAGTDPSQLRGINMGANSRKTDQLASALPRDTFVARFQDYKDNAIQLK